MSVFRVILLASAVGIGAACDDGSGAQPGEPATPSIPPEERAELAEAAGVTPEPTSAWPADTAGLLESIEAIGSAESCRERMRERIPVEIAEVMADLSYAQVIDDTCAGLVAVRDRSVEGCDALSVSALQRGCRRRLALVAGDPGACPDALAMPGRDPVCVAWAARDAGLCRAAGPAEEPRCRAVLSGDAAACRRYRGGDRARCEAEIRRYAGALGDERAESAASDVEPVFRLTAEVVARGGDPREPIVIEHAFLERGVHLAASGCGHRLSLVDPAGRVPSPVSFTDRPPSAQLELDVPRGTETPREVPLGPTTAALRIVLPGIGEASSIVGASGKVTITEWSAERGAAIAGQVAGELDLTPGRVRVRGEFRTFVRDVEAPTCPGGG